MKEKSTRTINRRAFATGLLAIALFAGQTLAQQSAAAAAAAPSTQTNGLAANETELAAKINVETIKEITLALSADEMQGRGTLQPGGEKAANYLAERFERIGLKPLGDKNTYLQKIKFKENVFAPETSFKLNDEPLKMGDDYIIQASPDKTTSGELVFIGYAMVVDAMKRNDLGDLNLQGKIVVMLQGPPAAISKNDWEKAKAQRIFVRNLFSKGVAGIIFVDHGREEHPFAEAAQYAVRRQIEMADEEPLPSQYPTFAAVSTKTAEKMFASSGTTFKDALALAETNNFKPIRLKQTAKITVKRKGASGTSSNVVGVLEGADPALKDEAVVFSAHYDAFGVGADGKIYHGAADNALGVAEMIAVAEAFAKSATKPKRSLVFLAVTGEEYGLYGSKYWAKNPTWKIKQVAADLNLDGIGTEVYAPVKTFVGFGAEHSTLGAKLADISRAMGIKVIADPMPDEKIFLRSDHYSFVEKGVPALMLLGAPDGDPQIWIKRSKEWEKGDYHNPGDVVKPDWAWEGAKTVADVMAITGQRVANDPEMPEWLSASRFAKLERGNSKELPEEK